MKKDRITALFILMILILSGQGMPAGENISRSIGGLSLGDDVDRIAILGIPVPVEEGGIHIIRNPKENCYLRIGKKISSAERFDLDYIRLSMIDPLYGKACLNDFQQITGSSLKGLKMGNGLGLGDSSAEMLKICGKPDRITNSGKVKIYSYSGKRSGVFLFNRYEVSGEKITAIEIGCEK